MCIFGQFEHPKKEGFSFWLLSFVKSMEKEGSWELEGLDWEPCSEGWELEGFDWKIEGW